MAAHEKLSIRTRIGTYATIIIVLLLSVLVLRNCVGAVYYGSLTSEEEVTHYFELGFAAGSLKIKNIPGQPERNIANPYLLKVYQKGFREGRDSIRNTMKRENNGKD